MCAQLCNVRCDIQKRLFNINKLGGGGIQNLYAELPMQNTHVAFYNVQL